MNAVENPLLDPIVWVILGLLGVGVILWLAAITKAGNMFAGLPMLAKFGIVIVALLGGILVVLVAMLSRG